jgi:hypothetical protein
MKMATHRVSEGNGGYLPLDGIYSSSDPGQIALARNKAYEQFKNQTGEYTQWANNLIEGRKTFNMIATRASQLLSVVSALKKGRFEQAYHKLGVSYGKKASSSRWSKSQHWSDAFLEVHFGWEPLVKDIYGGLKALTRDFSPTRVRGSGKMNYVLNQSTSSPAPYGRDISTVHWTRSVGVMIQGHVRVINPNVALANELGVLNPLAIAWEAVPFSFVVDWFSNVGQVLASATDFVGLEITRGQTTSFTHNYYNPAFSGIRSYVDMNGDTVKYGVYSNYGVKSINLARRTSIQGPTLGLKPFQGFSLTRGITAIALLVQTMSPRR